MNAIEIKKLTKKYKDVTAVDGLELSVRQGELFALLGVNGAGKTTTIKMLSCLTSPTSGEALLGGIDNKMPANNDLSQPLVHIKHFNVLGGTDVMTRVHKNA